MQQVDILLYRFRYVLATLLMTVVLLILTAIITSTGAGSILDTRATQTQPTASPVPLDSSNAVTVGAYALADGSKRATISLGTSLYSVSRSINDLAIASGKTVARTSTAAVVGSMHAISTVARMVVMANVATYRAVGNGMMAVVAAPAKAVGVVTRGQAVSALIRPSDTVSTPTIDAETSTAVLKHLNEQKQQEISKLLADQLAANRALVGGVVAGDPSHGGYPARWDNARQDSLVDSWGMYNRECVSYAAWKVYQTYGHMPYWGGVGNANQWVRNAKRTGIPTSSVPKAHSVAISMSGYYGHAMWVEKVQGDMIYVSQYNWDLRGHYSEMWVNAHHFTYIYFN